MRRRTPSTTRTDTLFPYTTRFRSKTRRKFRALASYQYIYVMKNLKKVYPGGREVLKNITLDFLPGAMIGVLGYNGADKSQLPRSTEGLEAALQAPAWKADGPTLCIIRTEP